LKFPERGCARSVSRSASKMLRLVFDTAALHRIRTLPWRARFLCHGHVKLRFDYGKNGIEFFAASTHSVAVSVFLINNRN
jgi:hypothetical protein